MEQDAAADFLVTWSDNRNDLIFGGLNWGRKPSDFFNGRLDQVFVLDRQMDASEALAAAMPDWLAHPTTTVASATPETDAHRPAGASTAINRGPTLDCPIFRPYCRYCKCAV